MPNDQTNNFPLLMWQSKCEKSGGTKDKNK